VGIDRLTGEWPCGLDVASPTAQGHVPEPFRQVVLKLTARCDLACDYCYVFAMADETWRRRPALMSETVLEAATDRIREHAERHGLKRLQIALHGGEPLLAGAESIDTVARRLRSRLPGIDLDLGLQTNGLLLDERLLDVLASHSIRIGVSLDGDRRANDRHRRHVDGGSSHTAVTSALALVRRHHPELFSGLLCIVDLDNDPVETYEALLEHGPPAIDLLLPLGNWERPPPGLDPGAPSTPYADWLIAVFDRWYPVARRETSIRLLLSVIRLLLGGDSQVEVLGLSPATVVVIDTDGSIEQVDTLRSAFPGATSTGLTVFRNRLDEALLHPGIVARQLGADSLCETCRACPLHRVCGGGYYPHRYRPGTGFLNPSVYCNDLQRLIGHVQARITADLAAEKDRGRTV
jgi:uncharacterized protein